MPERDQPKQTPKELFLKNNKDLLSGLRKRAAGLFTGTSLFDVRTFTGREHGNHWFWGGEWEIEGAVPEILSVKPVKDAEIKWKVSAGSNPGKGIIIEINPLEGISGLPLPEGILADGITYEIEEGVITRTVNEPLGFEIKTLSQLIGDTDRQEESANWAKEQGLNILSDQQVDEFVAFLRTHIPGLDVSEGDKPGSESIQGLERSLYEASLNSSKSSMQISAHLDDTRISVDVGTSGVKQDITVTHEDRQDNIERLSVSWVGDSATDIEFAMEEMFTQVSEEAITEARRILEVLDVDPSEDEMADWLNLTEQALRADQPKKAQAKELERELGFDIPTTEKVKEFDDALEKLVLSVQV